MPTVVQHANWGARMQTHTPTHTPHTISEPSDTAELAFEVCHNTVSATLLSPLLPSVPSLFQYTSPFLHYPFATQAAFRASLWIFFILHFLPNLWLPAASALCFPSPSHSRFYLLLGWKSWFVILLTAPSLKQWYESALVFIVGVFTFGSISVMFMIYWSRSEKCFLRCFHFLFSSRAAALRSSASL